MLFMGIDPGIKGGVAIISDSPEIYPCVYPLSNTGQLAIDLAACSFGHVVLEKAQTMPRQGICSAFSYGVGFGRLLQLIEDSGAPHTLVPPARWTKLLHVGCRGTPKVKSLQACRRLFPGVNLIPPGKRVPHDGIVDALLLAEYARRLHAGKV